MNTADIDAARRLIAQFDDSLSHPDTPIKQQYPDEFPRRWIPWQQRKVVVKPTAKADYWKCASMDFEPPTASD